MASTSRSAAARVYGNLPVILLVADVVLLGLGLSFANTARENSLCNPVTAYECGPWSITIFPYRAAIRGSEFMFAAALFILLGCVLWQTRRIFVAPEGTFRHRARAASAVVLLTAAIALLVLTAALGAVPTPSRTLSIADTAIRTTYLGNIDVLRWTTIEAYAGEAIEGSDRILWYTNGTRTFLGLSETIPQIVPSGQPMDIFEASTAMDYIVPRTGTYVVFVLGSACDVIVGCGGNYTTVASFDLLILNPNVLPPWQLGTFVSGAVAYLGSLAAAWERRPAATPDA